MSANVENPSSEIKLPSGDTLSKVYRSHTLVPATSARNALNILSPRGVVDIDDDKMRAPAPVLGCPKTIGGSYLKKLSNIEGMERNRVQEEFSIEEALDVRREALNSMLEGSNLRILNCRGISLAPVEPVSGRLDRKNPVGVLKALNDASKPENKGGILAKRKFLPSTSVVPSVFQKVNTTPSTIDIKKAA